jgi:hypothetical protein
MIHKRNSYDKYEQRIRLNFSFHTVALLILLYQAFETISTLDKITSPATFQGFILGYGGGFAITFCLILSIPYVVNAIYTLIMFPNPNPETKHNPLGLCFCF